MDRVTGDRAAEPGPRAELLRPVVESVFAAVQAQLAFTGLRIDLLQVSWREHRWMAAGSKPQGRFTWTDAMAWVLDHVPVWRRVEMTVRIGPESPDALLFMTPADRPETSIKWS